MNPPILFVYSHDARGIKTVRVGIFISIQSLGFMNLEELQSTLTDDLAAELLRGVYIIRALGEEDYKLVGAQFRHNLDFVNSLLNGLKEGRVDYNARQRDPRIEASAA